MLSGPTCGPRWRPGSGSPAQRGWLACSTEAGLPFPEIVSETLSSRLSAEDFWVVVLGTGWRDIVSQLEPESAERLRAAMIGRLDATSDNEVFSDVLYSVAKKAADIPSRGS